MLTVNESMDQICGRFGTDLGEETFFSFFPFEVYGSELGPVKGPLIKFNDDCTGK